MHLHRQLLQLLCQNKTRSPYGATQVKQGCPTWRCQSSVAQKPSAATPDTVVVV